MAGEVRGCSVRGRLALMAGALLLLVLPAASASAETLTVSKSPSTAPLGSVTSDPAGIDCGSDCTEDFPRLEECFENEHGAEICNDFPQSVTLTANPGNGFVSSGWTGCTDTDGDECSVSMTADKTVTAHYSDTQNPSAVLTKPLSGAKRGSIDLEATAGDNWGVDRVQFRVRGALVSTDSTAPYTGSFNTATIADGSAAVVAEAVDLAGRVGTSTTTNIVIDNTAPSLGVTGPDDQTFGPGSTQSWTFAISDSSSGIAQVRCSVVAGGSPAAFGPCSGGGGHSVSNLPGGDHELSVLVIDAAGNESIETRQFTIDATPPETSVLGGPPEGASSTATSMVFEFGSSEPGSTFLCRAYQAGLTPPGFAGCSGASSHSLSGLSPGTYVFEVVATDDVGNADPTPAARTFTVLPPPPIGPPAGPPAGGSNVGGKSSIDPRISKRWKVSRGRTQVRKLTLRNLPPGANVRVKCRGRDCPFRSKRVKPGGSSTSLTGLFKKRSLRPGTVVEVQVTAADGTGVLFRYVTRPDGKRPKSSMLCIAPGSTRPKSCS